MPTKHYYIEGERICTKIGGGFGLVAPLPPLDTAGTNTISFAAQLWTMVKRGFECAGNKVNDISILPGFSAINNSNNLENYRYYYHPDHLGSSSFISNQSGNVIEHLQYMPYGENFISQRSGRYDTPYKFSGKEKDEETQYSYFGARYYDSDLSIWLSVDPMANERNWISPYSYCQNNPVGKIDLTGALDTKYEDEKGNILLNTNDGSSAVITVKDSQLKGFNAAVKGTKNTNDPIWNNTMKKNYLGFELSAKQEMVLNQLNSDWSRKNAIEFWKDPTAENSLMASLSEALSQWTNPYLLVGGLSAGIGGLEANIKGNLNSFESIVENPQALWGKSASEIESILGEGWTKGTYGSNGQGWKFTNGDKSVFYNASSSAHGGAEYYGFSSGALGKNKIVNPSTYVYRAGDKATIIKK